MESLDTLSRRDFLAVTSGVLAAGGLAQTTSAAETATLAIEGGPKAVASSAPALVRWGEPELEQLTAMLEQNSLFYWKGPRTALLIERFKQVCPHEHVMTCSSGTAALHIAVNAAKIGPGDEVITSSITDMGTVIGILYQQGVPVFADLVPNTYNLDPADVERRITPKTKAIIVVHLTGNPCDMAAFRALADKHNLVLIEDCCQAWGARYAGEPLGTQGDIACFSFQNSKHVTCGDGGIVASSDDRFGPRLQPCGDKGFMRVGGDGTFHEFATNYRMSEPQAAVAAAQLTRLESIAETRSRLGNLLTEKISGIDGLEPHHVRSDDRSVYWFYMFRIRPKAFRCDRRQFVKALSAEGVPASAGYIPVPLYGNPVFQNHSFFAGRWPIRELGLTTMDYSNVSCPETEAILSTGIRVVINEAMDEEYVLSVAEGIRKVADSYVA